MARRSRDIEGRKPEAQRGDGDDLVIFDAPPGGWAWLEVRAWARDARRGATYEEVLALDIGGYGESSLFYARGNLPGQSLAEIPAELIGLRSLSLRPIAPEPLRTRSPSMRLDKWR